MALFCIERLRRLNEYISEYKEEEGWEEWDLFAQWKEEQHRKAEEVMNKIPDSFYIIAKTTTRKFYVPCNEHGTIQQLMSAIEELTGISQYRQRIIWKGRQWGSGNDLMLKDIGFEMGTEIHIVEPLRGD